MRSNVLFAPELLSFGTPIEHKTETFIRTSKFMVYCHQDVNPGLIAYIRVNGGEKTRYVDPTRFCGYWRVRFNVRFLFEHFNPQIEQLGRNVLYLAPVSVPDVGLLGLGVDGRG